MMMVVVVAMASNQTTVYKGESRAGCVLGSAVAELNHSNYG